MSQVLDILGRGFVFVLALAFLAWRVHRRWKGAGEYVAEMQEEEKRERAAFQAMPWDPMFVRLKTYVDARYRTTFEAAVDPAAFRIHYATFLDSLGQPTWPGLPAKWLVAYLRNARSKIVVTLDLANGQVFERQAGWTDWDLVPVWAR